MIDAADALLRRANAFQRNRTLKVLLIDEPSLGLAPVMVQEVFEILKRLKSEGRTIRAIEQNTHMALDVADHVFLMQGGRVTLSTPASEVNLTQLHDLYFAR